MTNYLIFIPTRGRLDSQFTWDNIPEELRSKTFIVCPEEEADGHRERGRNVITRPTGKLSYVRQWLVEQNQHVDCIIMLDDDLSFFTRKDPTAHNLRPISGRDVVDLFEQLAAPILSGEFVHGGISPRQGNNWLFPKLIEYNTRMNAVHAVNPKKLKELGVYYDTVDLMEDYFLTLTLFSKGYGNFQLANYAWDQNRGSGAPGGFSGYRTQEIQKRAAEKLHELHPRHVKVVIKKPKTGANDWAGERTDVRISWKKSAKDGGVPNV